MLDNTRAVHAINVRQSQRLRVLIDDLDMDQAEIAIEVVAQNLELGVGDDAFEYGADGDATLAIEGIMLD